ncbi:MAG: hypothetical protein WCH43_09345 [Verrucomicrobiota bacterium]
MKSILRFALIAVLCTLIQPVFAGNSDVVINTVAKKIEDKSAVPAAGEGSIAEKKEEWAYMVTVENKSFKPLTGLEAKYIIFYKQDQIGSKVTPRLQRKSGSCTVPEIQASGKNSFTTNSVELKKSVLTGNYYFTNGAKTKAEDGLSGIWIRIYLNGNLFAEYTRPTSLSSKEKWE